MNDCDKSNSLPSPAPGQNLVFKHAVIPALLLHKFGRLVANPVAFPHGAPSFDSLAGTVINGLRLFETKEHTPHGGGNPRKEGRYWYPPALNEGPVDECGYDKGELGSLHVDAEWVGRRVSIHRLAVHLAVRLVSNIPVRVTAEQMQHTKQSLHLSTK